MRATLTEHSAHGYTPRGVPAPVHPAQARDSFRILFVTPYVPSPLRPRPFNLLRQLAERGHRTTLLAVATSAREAEERAALEPWCERIEIVRVPLARSLRNCAAALAGGVPLQAAYCQSPVLAGSVRELASGHDLVHVEHLRAALSATALDGVPCVLDAVDSIGRLLAQTAVHGPTLRSRLLARVELARTRRFERRLPERFARVLVASRAERRHLLGPRPDEVSAARVTVITNGVDAARFAPPAVPREPATLVYHGRMSYHANVSAALQLLREVMPRVWLRRPDARLMIVGADPPAAIRRLARGLAPRVVVTGRVPDVAAYLGRATVGVFPLRYAVGIQNKLLEALATGLPVVTTPIAAAGAGAEGGVHLLIGSDAAAIAAHVVDLLGDGALRRRLGEAGRAHVARHHRWDATADAVEHVYAEIVGGCGRRATAA